MTRPNPTMPMLTITPLESGDRVTRAEFEQRYTAMPEVKAELIEGAVFIASPLRAKGHGKPHTHIMTWLGTYEAATPGVEDLDNSTIRLDTDNEPQPDALLRIEHGGQSRISEDDYEDAMLSGDLARVLTVLQQGPATVEHQNFVANPQVRQTQKRWCPTAV